MPPTTDDSNSSKPSLDDLISLRHAAELSGLSASQLRLLVSRGDIRVRKTGRNCVTAVKGKQVLITDCAQSALGGGPHRINRLLAHCASNAGFT